MTAERLARLTDGQRECLRGVFMHKSSKEIARELGISKDTVDQRLDRARKLLGAATRVEAAQMLAEADRSYHRVVYDPVSIAGAPPAAAAIASVDGGRQQATTADLKVGESQASYIAFPHRISGLRLPLPVGDGPNTLSAGQRLIGIGLAAVGIIVAVGTLVTIAEGISRPVITVVQLLS